MVEVAFHYIDTFSLLHRLDPRSKVLLLIGLSITGTVCRLTGLFILIPAVILGLLFVRVPVGRLARELRTFIYFFLLIVLVSSIDISAEGEPFLRVNPGGFLEGLRTVARMLFIILLATLFTSTTKTREMREAIWWFLHRVPFVNAERIAVMFSLSIRFIPLLFEQASMIGRSLAARGTTGRALKQMRLTAVLLIVNSFRRVDAITMAMISRCHTDKVKGRNLEFHRRDLICLVCAAGVCIVVLL